MSDVIYRQVGKDHYYRTWHKSEKNMFLLLHSGDGSIVTRDGSFPMSEGTLCFIGNEKYHYTFPEHAENYVRSKIFISSNELSALMKILNISAAFPKKFDSDQIHIAMLDAQNIQIAEQLFRRLDQISLNSNYYQAELYSAVFRLIVLLCEGDHTRAHTSVSGIQSAVNYINEHISEDLTIEDICKSVYMSKYYFCRLFKEKTGMTVMKYILQTRIMMAKEMLRSGNMPIAHISEACAFSSISYFSRIFKSETGMTPLQYKKKNSKQL